MAEKKQKQTEPKDTTSIYVTKAGRKLFNEMHEQYRPRYKTAGFFDELLEVYAKSRCPECGNEISFKECPCKAPERL